MDLSVVICTYNRADLLKNTLKSLDEQKDVNFDWELILVDNNSKDHTREVVDEFVNRIPNLKYFFESKQGISFAKNKGVRETRGEVIAFTDDDVLVDLFWLSKIYEFFKGNPNVACVGGKILPLWEENPPSWLTKSFYPYLALLDLGDEPVRMDSPDLWGANLSIRRDMFEKYGEFDERVGRSGKKLYSGEETLFLFRLLNNNEEILYVPWIEVKHFVPKERMKKNYFRKWKFYHGKTKATLTEEIDKSSKKLMNIPVYSIKFLILQIIRYLKHSILLSPKAFLEELELISCAGFIYKKLEG